MTAIITPTVIPIKYILVDEFGELSVPAVELDDDGLNVVVHVYVRRSNR